jgi:hypothetical protein
MFQVSTSYRPLFAGLGLDSAGSMARFFFGEIPENKSGVQVFRRELPAKPDPVPIFCKQYYFAKPSWEFFGRKSKASCEWNNYAIFSRLGIPCAETIACGEERDAVGRLRRAFIVTREIPHAQTLVEFLKNNSPSRAVRVELVRQIAVLTRRIHHAGFFHYDLVWRNILVTLEPAPKLWWIDCPRGQFDHWSPLRNRRRLKDLASLDKLASRFCTARERIRFIQIYLEKKKLDRAAKNLIRAELSYRKKRWPEDWMD